MPTSDELFALRAELEAEQKRNPALKRLHRMHLLYGTTEGQRCQDCVSFLTKQYAGTYFKCRRYGNTGGPATDWRARWPACGKFEPRDETNRRNT